jgi:hypothetical protein
VTVVYEGDRQVLRSGLTIGTTSVSSLPDVTGDRRAELVISEFSGGMHCCHSTAVFSIESSAVPLFSANTGDCSIEAVDLDGDGVPELRTCDPAFGYRFCTYAYSPMPTVVLAYSRPRREFVVSTPRYARYLELPTIEEARTLIATNPEIETRRCAALQPLLALVYAGRAAEGQKLFRALYREPDAAAVEREALATARASALWTAR